MKKNYNYITGYAFVNNSKPSGATANKCSVMCPMPTTSKCNKSDIHVIGTFQEEGIITDPISRMQRRKMDCTIITGCGNSVTWKVTNPHKYYLEFLKALEDEICVLNSAFLVEVDEKKKFTRIKVAYDHLADDVSKKFDGRKIVAQAGNFVLLDNGIIGWINWLCLVRSAKYTFMYPFCGDAELQAICKNNKRFRGPNGPTEQYINIKPYEFIAGENAYYLLCEQFETFDELSAYAETLKK